MSLSLAHSLFLPAAYYTHNRAPGIEPAVTIVGGGHRRLYTARTGIDIDKESKSKIAQALQ